MSHELGDTASKLVPPGKSTLETVRFLEASSSAALHRLQVRLGLVWLNYCIKQISQDSCSSLIVTPQASSEAYTHLDIPSHILRPDYVTSGGKVDQDKLPRRPVTWSQAEIDSIRRSANQKPSF